MNKRAPPADRIQNLRKRQWGRRGEDEGLGVGRRTRNGALDLDRVGGRALVAVLRERDDLVGVGAADSRVAIGEPEGLLLLKPLLVGYRHFADVSKQALTVGAHDRKVAKIAHLTARLVGR